MTSLGPRPEREACPCGALDPAISGSHHHATCPAWREFGRPGLSYERQRRDLVLENQRRNLLDPNQGITPIQAGYLFTLPPPEVVVGIADARLFTSDHPDTTLRAERFTIAAPAPGVFTLRSLTLGNVLTVKGPIDAFAFSSGSSLKRATGCTHCGAPVAWDRAQCRYCQTVYPPREEVRELGRVIPRSILRPSIRASVELAYSGATWPGGPPVLSAFELTMGLIGPAVVDAGGWP